MLHRCCSNTHDAYTSYYLSTSGQRYWSDLGQLSVYIDDYHADLDRRLGSPHKGSEMITELYVPRPALSDSWRLCAPTPDSKMSD